jgi:hypothetical protein
MTRQPVECCRRLFVDESANVQRSSAAEKSCLYSGLFCYKILDICILQYCDNALSRSSLATIWLLGLPD